MTCGWKNRTVLCCTEMHGQSGKPDSNGSVTARRRNSDLESFVMTPLYCGYDVWLEEQDSPLLHGDARPKRKAGLERFGYRPTAEYRSGVVCDDAALLRV